jgi:hypothetical protein
MRQMKVVLIGFWFNASTLTFFPARKLAAKTDLGSRLLN